MVSFKSQFEIREWRKLMLNMAVFLPIDCGCHSHPPADFRAEYQELAFHSPPAGLLLIRPLVWILLIVFIVISLCELCQGRKFIYL